MIIKKISKKQYRNPFRKSKLKKKLNGGKLADFNYISNILIGLSDRLYTNPLVKYNINQMIRNVRSVWDIIFNEKRDRFKKYTHNDIEYSVSSESDFTIDKKSDDPRIGFFLKKQKIINSIHKIKTVKMSINSEIIEVNFYYDDNFNKENLEKNIHMIITRLYNLCILFEDKKTSFEIYNEEIDDSVIINGSILNFTHHIYLYSNPRRVKLTGNNNDLMAMYNSEEACFNIPGGLTSEPDSLEGFFTINSKLEDILGLFTHEILHVVKLGFQGAPKKALPKVSFRQDPKMLSLSSWTGTWLNEYVINAHASIIHSYLIHYEMDISLNDSLKYELIYQFIQTLKLGKIHGITLKSILLTDTPLFFEQKTPLFEYIYVRTLILYYYNKMSENLKTCFIDMKNGITDIFNEPCNFTDFIIDILDKTQHNELIDLLDEIDDFLNEYMSKRLPESDDVCGKAIMNYFCLDPIIIDDKNKLSALYGGIRYN